MFARRWLVVGCSVLAVGVALGFDSCGRRRAHTLSVSRPTRSTLPERPI